MERDPDTRLDVHNAAVDTEIAGAHLCATTDLRTGRTCIKPFPHGGPCEFVSKPVARQVAEETAHNLAQ